VTTPARADVIEELQKLFEPDAFNELLDRIDPETIIAKLRDLDCQASSLRVLLRAVRSRQRSRPVNGRKAVPHGAA
jgi:hypothetical protein